MLLGEPLVDDEPEMAVRKIWRSILKEPRYKTLKGIRKGLATDPLKEPLKERAEQRREP